MLIRPLARVLPPKYASTHGRSFDRLDLGMLGSTLVCCLLPLLLLCDL